MKKTMAILLSLALVLSLLSVGAAGQSADITGLWYGDLYGMVMTLTLEGAGDYTLEMDGEDTDIGKWELDGEALKMDAGTERESIFVYNGESIYADFGESMEIFFTREPIEPFQPAAARTDVKLEEFSGEWVCTLVSMYGMQVPPEIGEMDMQLSIAGDVVTMTLSLMGEPVTKALQAAFDDGALTLLQSPEHELADFTVWVIRLLEDGTLSASTTMFEEPFDFYLEAVAE